MGAAYCHIAVITMPALPAVHVAMCRAEMEQLPLLLLNILHHNYSMVHIPWSIAHDVRAVQQAGSWNVPVPAMDAVTAPQLAYDLWTTQSIRCVCVYVCVSSAKLCGCMPCSMLSRVSLRSP